MYQSTRKILAETKGNLKTIVEVDKEAAYEELIKFLTEELKSSSSYTRKSEQ